LIPSAVASTGEEGDIRDLENHIRQGASLQETAGFLCRAETVEAVAEKAKELELTFQPPRRQDVNQI